MKQQVIKVGDQVLNLAYVSHAKFEGTRLYIHLSGGRFTSFDGEQAKVVWQALSESAIDVMTGEAPERK